MAIHNFLRDALESFDEKNIGSVSNAKDYIHYKIDQTTDVYTSAKLINIVKKDPDILEGYKEAEVKIKEIGTENFNAKRKALKKAIEGMNNTIAVIKTIESKRSLENLDEYTKLLISSMGYNAVSTEGILGDLWKGVKNFFGKIFGFFGGIVREWRTGEKKFKKRANAALDTFADLTSEQKDWLEKEGFQRAANNYEQNQWLVYDGSKMIDSTKYVQAVVDYTEKSSERIGAAMKEFKNLGKDPSGYGKLAKRLENADKEIESYTSIPLSLPNVTIDKAKYGNTSQYDPDDWLKIDRADHTVKIKASDAEKWLKNGIDSYSKYVSMVEKARDAVLDASDDFETFLAVATDEEKVVRDQNGNVISKTTIPGDAFAKQLEPLFLHMANHLEFCYNLVLISYKHMQAGVRHLSFAINAADD